jgi:exopolysaccharide production protein ExoQ
MDTDKYSNSSPQYYWICAFYVFLFVFCIGLNPIREEYLLGEVVRSGSLLVTIERWLKSAVVLFVLYKFIFEFEFEFSKININSLLIYSLPFLFCMVITLLNSSSVFQGLKKIVDFAIIYYALVIFVVKLGSKFILLAVRNFLFVGLLLSIPISLFVTNAVHSYDALDPDLIGAWKGIFGHKNQAGFAVGVFSIFAIINFKNRWVFQIATFAFLLFYIYFTQAKTVIPFVLIALFFTWAVQFGNREVNKVKFLAPFVCFLLSLVVVCFVFYSNIVIFLQEPTSLTGRAYIWQMISAVIEDNLFFGLGVGGVFGNAELGVLYDYVNDWRQFIYHSHSGFLEVILYTGVCGLLVFVSSYFFYTLTRLDNSLLAFEAKLIIFAVLIYLFLYNWMESAFYNESSLGWFFLMLCAALLTLNDNEMVEKRA